MAGMADPSLLPPDYQSWPRIKARLLDLYRSLIGCTTGLKEVCRRLQEIRNELPLDSAVKGHRHKQGQEGWKGDAVPHHMMTFVDRMGQKDQEKFLFHTLPGVIQIALATDEFGEEEKSAWSLHQSGTKAVVSRQFLCSVLACQFLHLSPGKNLFSAMARQFSSRPSVGLQWQSVLDYFEWVIKCGLEVKGQFILHRKVPNLSISIDDLTVCDVGLCPLTFVHDDQLKSLEEDVVQIHLSSSSSHQTVTEGLDYSLVRLYPELLALDGRVEGMSGNEVFVVSGLDSSFVFKSLSDADCDDSMDDTSQENEDSTKRMQGMLVVTAGAGFDLVREEEKNSRSSSSLSALQRALNLALLGFSGHYRLPDHLEKWKGVGDGDYGKEGDSKSNRMAMYSAGTETNGDDSPSYPWTKHSLNQDIFSIDDIDDDDNDTNQGIDVGQQLHPASQELDWPQQARQHQLEKQQQQQHPSLFEIGDVQKSIPFSQQQQQQQQQNLCQDSSQFTIPATSPLLLSSSSISSSSSPQVPSSSSPSSSNKPPPFNSSSVHMSLLPSKSVSSSFSTNVYNLSGASTYQQQQYSNVSNDLPGNMSIQGQPSTESNPLQLSNPTVLPSLPSTHSQSQSHPMSTLPIGLESYRPSSHDANMDIHQRDGKRGSVGGGCISPKPVTSSSSGASPSPRALHNQPLIPAPISQNLPLHGNYDKDLYSRFLLADVLGNLTKSNNTSGAMPRTNTTTTFHTASACNTSSSTISNFSQFSSSSHLPPSHAIPIHFQSSQSYSSPTSSKSLLPVCDNPRLSWSSPMTIHSSDSSARKQGNTLTRPNSASSSSSQFPIVTVIHNPPSLQSPTSSSPHTQWTPPSLSSTTPAVPVPTTAAASSQLSTATPAPATTIFYPLTPLQVDIPSIETHSSNATTTTTPNPADGHSSALSSSSSPHIPHYQPNSQSNTSCTTSLKHMNLVSPTPSTSAIADQPLSEYPHCHHRCQSSSSTTTTILLEPPLLSSSPQSSSSSMNNSPNSSFTLPDPALIRNTNVAHDVEVTADFFIPGIDDHLNGGGGGGNDQLQSSSTNIANTANVDTTPTTSSNTSTPVVAGQPDNTYSILPPGTNGSRDFYLQHQLHELISSSSSSSGSTDRGVGGGLLAQMGFPPPLSSSGCSHWGSRSGSISSHGTNGSGSSNDFMELWYNLRRRSSQMSDASRTSSSSKHSSDFSTDLEDISEALSKHAHEVIEEEEGGAITLLSELASHLADTALNVSMIEESQAKEIGDSVVGLLGQVEDPRPEGGTKIICTGESLESGEKEEGFRDSKVTSKKLITPDTNVEDGKTIKFCEGGITEDLLKTHRTDLVGVGKGDDSQLTITQSTGFGGKEKVKEDNQSLREKSSDLGAEGDVTGHLLVNVRMDSTLYSSPTDSAFHSGVVSPSPSSSISIPPHHHKMVQSSTSPSLESGLGDSNIKSCYSPLRQSAPSPSATFSLPQEALTVELCGESADTPSSFVVLESKVVYLEEKETKRDSKGQKKSSSSHIHLSANSTKKNLRSSVINKNKSPQTQPYKSPWTTKPSPSSIPSASTATQISRASSKSPSQSQFKPPQRQRQSPPKSPPSSTSKTSSSQIPGRTQTSQASPIRGNQSQTLKTTPPVAIPSAKPVLKSNTHSKHLSLSIPISSSSSSSSSSSLPSSGYVQKSQKDSYSSQKKATSLSKGVQKSSFAHTHNVKSSPSSHATTKRVSPSSGIPKSKSSSCSLYSSTTKAVTKFQSSSPLLTSSSRRGRKEDTTKSSPAHSPRSRYLFSDVAAPLKTVSSASNSSSKVRAKHKQPLPGVMKSQTLVKKGRESRPKPGVKEKKSPEHKPSSRKRMTSRGMEVRKFPKLWQFVSSLVQEVMSTAIAEGAAMSLSTGTLSQAVGHDMEIDKNKQDPVNSEELSDEVYTWFADKIVRQVFFTVLESIEPNGKEEDNVYHTTVPRTIGGERGGLDNSSYTDDIYGLVSLIAHDGASVNQPSDLSQDTYSGTEVSTSATPLSAVPGQEANNASSSPDTKLALSQSHSLNKTVSFEDSSHELVMRTGSEGDLTHQQSLSQHFRHLSRCHHQRTSSGSYNFTGFPSFSSPSGHQPLRHYHHLHNHQQQLYHHHQHPQHCHHHERLSTSAWSMSSAGSNGSQERLNLNVGGSSSDIDTMSYGSSSEQHFLSSSNSSSLLRVQKRLTKSATDLVQWSSLTSMECSWGNAGAGRRGSIPNGSPLNLRAGDSSVTTGRSSSGGRMTLVAAGLTSRSTTFNRRGSLTLSDSTSQGSLLESGRLYSGGGTMGLVDSAVDGRRGSLTNTADGGGDSSRCVVYRRSSVSNPAVNQEDGKSVEEADDPRLYEAAVSIVNQVFNSISDTLDLEILRASDQQHQLDALYPGASYRSGQYHNIFSSSCQTASSSPSSMRRRSHHNRHRHHHRSVSPSMSVFSRKPMSRESLTNAFLKVDSQPSVQNYERRSSEPCHTSVQLSLEVFNKNRYNYKPAEEPQQTACTDDDIGRTGSRISWRRGSLDNNFSFEGGHSHGTMSGFKDPILSRFAEELMKADTSVPELVLMGSNPSSCTTGSRRSSFSGFRDTTLANLESELLNTSFTSMNSLPLSQSPRSVGGRTAATGSSSIKGNNSNNNARSRGWEQQHQLQSDSSDTEHWFPLPRHVGDEFQLEFTRQHSQGGQDEVQDLASFFAGCVVQEAVCVIKSDPDYLTEDQMAIGLYAENLTDQILRDVFLSTRSQGQQEVQGSQGSDTVGCDHHQQWQQQPRDSCRDERGDDKKQTSNRRSRKSGDPQSAKNDKDGEKNRDGHKISSPSYYGQGARPKVRTLSSSSTRTHTGGRLSNPSTSKSSSSTISYKKPVPGRPTTIRNVSACPDSKHKSGEVGSSASNKAGIQVKVKESSLSTAISSRPRSSSGTQITSSNPQQGRLSRHHQSDFGPTLSSISISSSSGNIRGSHSLSRGRSSQRGRVVPLPGSSLFEAGPPSSSATSQDRKLLSAPTLPATKGVSKSSSSFSHERPGKSRLRASRSATAFSSFTCHGSGVGHSRLTSSDFSSGSDNYCDTQAVPPDSALSSRSLSKSRMQEDHPHARTQRQRNDSEASSSSYSCLDSDPPSSSPRPAATLDDQRKRKFIRQDALSPSSHHKLPAFKGKTKGKKSDGHNRRQPEDRKDPVDEGSVLAGQETHNPLEVVADRFATVLTDRILSDGLREVELLPWWRWFPTCHQAIATRLRCESDGQMDLLAKWMAASLLQCPHLVLTVGTEAGLPSWMADAERIVQMLSAKSLGFLASAIKNYWQLHGDSTGTGVDNATTTTTTTSDATATGSHSEVILPSPSVPDDNTGIERQLDKDESYKNKNTSLPSALLPLVQSQLSSSQPPPPPPPPPPSPPPTTSAATLSLATSSSPLSSPALPTLPTPSLFHFLKELFSSQQDQSEE